MNKSIEEYVPLFSSFLPYIYPSALLFFISSLLSSSPPPLFPSGEIRSGTVVTYNDKEEILCENCSPDVTLNETPPHNVSSPPPPAASHSPRDNRDPSTAQTKPTPPPPAPPTSQNILETSTNNINSNGSSSSNSISTKKNKNSKNIDGIITVIIVAFSLLHVHCTWWLLALFLLNCPYIFQF